LGVNRERSDEWMDEKRCPKCLAANPVDALLCAKCGELLLQGLNLFKTLVEIRQSTVKRDDYMIKQSLLHMTTAFLSEPANLGVEGPSSEGKTYPVVETARLFPDDCVWYLAGLSPTALAHDYGELVDALTRKPLQPKLSQLQFELEILKGDRSKEAREKRVQIQNEILKMMKNAAYLINLEGKILLFLDRPHPETLQKLYPILSHDSYEASYKFTDRAKGPLRTVHVILQGWPVAIFIRTKPEGEADTWQQTISRFTTISPRMDRDKYREAIRLRSAMRGLPQIILSKFLGLDAEEWAKKALEMVRQRLMEIRDRVRASTGCVKANMFWVPFHEKIGNAFPAEIGRRMRDADRFLALIQAHAAINVFARPRCVFPDGSEYIICVFEDFEEVAKLYFSEEEKKSILTGLPRHVVDFFEKAVLPLWREKKSGLTVSELVDVALKNLGKALAENTIRRHYISPLENAGFVTVEPDPEDKRRNRIRVLMEDIGDAEKTCNNVLFTDAFNFSLEDLKEAWNKLIKICAHISTPNNTHLTNGLPRIEDWDGSQLSIEDLYNKYFILEQDTCARILESENQASSSERTEKKYECAGKHENARFSIVREAQGGICEFCGAPAEVVAEVGDLGRRYMCRKCAEQEDASKNKLKCGDCRFHSAGRCAKHPEWITVLPSCIACELFEPKEEG